jgi:uncharacterized Tic20 family protein
MTGPGEGAAKAVRPRVRLSAHERRWAPAAHAAAIPTMLLGLGFVGPLLVGRYRGGGSPFVRHHVVQAVNFNFTVAIAAYASSLVMVFGAHDAPRANEVIQPNWVPAAALSVLIVLLVYWFLFTVRAMISASYGEWFRYPRSLRLMR